MSRRDRDKWNDRYRQGAYALRTYPSALVAEHVPGILGVQSARDDAAPALRALDVACGAGRNALYLARLGYRVDALDISREALASGRRAAAAEHLDISWIEHDLDLGLPRGIATYDLVLVMRYLDLSLVTAVAERLNPGGYLISEVHLVTDQPVIGPRDPNFRVRPGELRRAAPMLDVGDYWEGLAQDPDGRAVALARMVACCPSGRP